MSEFASRPLTRSGKRSRMKEKSLRLSRPGSDVPALYPPGRAPVGKRRSWPAARRQKPGVAGSIHAHRKKPGPSSCRPQRHSRPRADMARPADFAAAPDMRPRLRPDTFRQRRPAGCAVTEDQKESRVAREKGHSWTRQLKRRASL